MAELTQTRILHVAFRTDWADAVESGGYTVSSRGRTLAEEGFIHASTQEQAGPVLRRYYADLDPAELILLVLDVGLLEAAGSPVSWDEVPFSDAPFPHVYGPIVPSAVVATLPLAGTIGAPELPDLAGHDVVLTSQSFA